MVYLPDIVMSRKSKNEIQNIFVKSIFPNGQAVDDGTLKVLRPQRKPGLGLGCTFLKHLIVNR